MPGMRTSSSTRSGVVRDDDRQHLGAVHRLADDLEAAVGLESPADAVQDQPMVVRDHHTHGIQSSIRRALFLGEYLAAVVSREAQCSAGASRRAMVLNPAMTLTVLNPATEEPIAELEQAGVEETDAAVARAKAAFPAWRAVAPADRARLLRRLASARRGERGGARAHRVANVGKPIAGARGEIGMVAQVFHFYAGAVDKHCGETIPVAGGVDVDVPRAARRRRADRARGTSRSTSRAGSSARRSRRGNTVVLKPAELTPLSALRARRARARGRDPGGRR